MENLNPEQIDEIAENIDMGMLCFYHIPSGRIVTLVSEVAEVDSDLGGLYSEEELKDRNQLDDIEAHLDEYISFEKMSSRNAFEVMRSFALSYNHDTVKENLLLSLEKQHPFQSFKNALYSLPKDVSNEWYAFKNRKTRRWVEEQLELYDF